MADEPSTPRKNERGPPISWRRVLVVLAATWVLVMLAIYWIIRTAKW